MAKIRSCVENMVGYVPGEPALDERSVKLNQNENRYAPSAGTAEAIRVELARLSLYPESSSRGVREVAGDIYGVDADQVMAANGSDELLRLLFQLVCGPGDEVAAFYPGYTYYATLAAMHDVRFKPVDLTGAMSIPERLDFAGTKLVLLANPNAPTGTLFPLDEIRRLAAAVRDGLLAVDEAYIDFAPVGSTALPLIGEFDNVVVIRTLSKSYALAGLRVGLGFARKGIMAQMEKIRDYYNLDRLAQAGAAAALRDREWLAATTARIVAARERTVRAVEALGLRVYPSHANFILVDFGSPEAAERVFLGLRAMNVLVRHFRDRRVDSCLRVTIGADGDMDAFLSALTACLREAPGEPAP